MQPDAYDLRQRLAALLADVAANGGYCSSIRSERIHRTATRIARLVGITAGEAMQQGREDADHLLDA